MRHLRYILILVVFLLLVSGCSNSNSIVKERGMKSKNITIQIDDNQNNEQHYSIQIMTNGKETKKIAVFPQVESLITDSKKQVKVEVVEGVSYTIQVFKTNVQSVQEQYNKPKTVESLSQKVEPLAVVKYTPSTDSYKLKIKVNSD